MVVLSFIVLICAAILWVLSALITIIWDPGGIVPVILGLLQLFVNVGLVVIVAYMAFPFARSRRRSAWWIIYWIIVVVALVGAVTGFIPAVI